MPMANSNGFTLKVKESSEGEHFFDFNLFFLVLFMCFIGTIMVYSSSAYFTMYKLKRNSDGTLQEFFFLKRQLEFVGAGFVVMLIMSFIDYHYLRARTRLVAFADIVLIVAYILQFYVLLKGISANGASRWLSAGSNRTFQPAEFSKFAIILYTAMRISTKPLALDYFSNFVVDQILVLPLTALIAKENLSSAIIAAGIFFVMCFANCRKSRYVIAGGAFYAGLAALYVKLKPGYRAGRVAIWRNLEGSGDAGQQILQGLYAITSGGIFGTGLGGSVQKYGRVPEAYNDMIFTIICEELGMFGAIAVIVLYVLVIYRLSFISINAPDVFGSMFTVGVLAQIAIQALLNILVVTNSIPSTGVTLPFISYGGSAMLIQLFEIGVVLNISRQINYRRGTVM